jgi:membrane-associated phospholipid phosphatase
MSSMAPIRVKPTEADVAIADNIAAHTDRPTEYLAEALSWGAEEHVLCALAIGWWLYARTRDVQVRRASNHVLLTTIVASVLPHILKEAFDQQRPDRLTVLGHLHGVPVSGKRLDAFPSGHAVHVGALASAAAGLPPAQRNAVWAVGGGLVLTRIVLLAHWTSDVVAGLAVGAAIERLLRFVTGFDRP